MQFDKYKMDTMLKGIPGNKRMLVSLRSAMRMLPLLALKDQQVQSANEVFWFWKREHKADCLLRVYLSYVQVLTHLLVKNSVNVSDNDPHIYAHTMDMAYSADSLIFLSANEASDVIHAAAQIASCAFIDGEGATPQSSVELDTTGSFFREIKNDLSVVHYLSLSELVTRPLWSESVPEHVKQLGVNLKKDILDLNSGFEVWLDWYELRLQGNPVDVELIKQWHNVPKEIYHQGPKKVNAYFKTLAQKTAKQPLNRLRVIFIGYGKAGKTSLIRALHKETVIEGAEEMTTGIDIRPWSVPKTNIQADFWDFGGQVMVHSTHQFFLREHSLYVLVINLYSEIDTNNQAEYWLEHIKAFGKNAPVMLVGNKIDKVEFNLDMTYLKKNIRTLLLSILCLPPKPQNDL